MRYLQIALITFLAFFVTNCASKPRTKWTDPNMRCAIDPDGLSARDYIRLVDAVKKTGRFFVVDRRDGLRQIFKEQKMIYKERPDQFADIEKYSHYGKLYGVGAVITGHVECARHTTFFGSASRCMEHLAIVSTISGEVIATSEAQADDAELDYYGDIKIGPSWTDAVTNLVDAFPKNFQKEEYNDDMRLFREETREQAIRQKENLGHDKAMEEKASITDEAR